MHFLCLPGDGIGPEIVTATRAIVSAVAKTTSTNIEWSEMAIGLAALKVSSSTIPNSVIEAARAADGVLLGPVSHNEYPPLSEGGLNPSGVLRSELELYANIRPALSIKALDTPISRSVDLVIYRENLEGFYADRNMASGGFEFMAVDGVALAMRKITALGSERIARAAFEGAMSRNRGKVTAVHKANVMRLSDGLFLQEVRKVAAEFPDIEYDEVLVDAAAALLVHDPDRFDVIVTTNMFGDILSNLASELSGGLGLAGSLNLGPQYAIAQAQHGSAPDIAGKDLANPTSLLRSAAMLLRHLGASPAEHAIEELLNAALSKPETRTRDLNGQMTSSAFTKHLVDQAAKWSS